MRERGGAEAGRRVSRAARWVMVARELLSGRGDEQGLYILASFEEAALLRVAVRFFDPV